MSIIEICFWILRSIINGTKVPAPVNINGVEALASLKYRTEVPAPRSILIGVGTLVPQK